MKRPILWPMGATDEGDSTVKTNQTAAQAKLQEETSASPPQARAADYAVLLKPQVMSLVVFTGIVGMMLAPGSMDLVSGILAVLFMAVGAGASGAINMWYDRDIDRHMKRTAGRPIPAGRMHPRQALIFGVSLAVGSVGAMGWVINWLAGGLLALTIVYYVFVYTVWLKRRTPQNIVIGGAAGALPPVIGWAASSGTIGVEALVLFSIIFFWTPPHFWALSLFCRGDYEKAGVPMLPVVAGTEATKRHILVYTLILIPITLLPSLIGMSGWIYGGTVGVLGLWLLRHAIMVWRDQTNKAGRPMFFFSIFYLFIIFAVLLVDRAVPLYL